jgi:hypothetical protein
MLLVAVIHHTSGWNATHAFPDQDYCRHASLPIPLLFKHPSNVAVLHSEFNSFLVLYNAENVKSWFQEW